jgi:hypothetical protein
MIRAFTAGPNCFSKASCTSAAVGSTTPLASRRRAIIGQTMSSAYCRSVTPRSWRMRSIHLSRGTLNRRDMASISASTSAAVTCTPALAHDCSMIRRLTIVSSTAEPCRARHSAASWSAVISAPSTSATGRTVSVGCAGGPASAAGPGAASRHAMQAPTTTPAATNSRAYLQPNHARSMSNALLGGCDHGRGRKADQGEPAAAGPWRRAFADARRGR